MVQKSAEATAVIAYYCQDKWLGRDYFLWKTSAITEIAPLGSSWSYLVYIQSGLILFGRSLLPLGYSPLIPHRWKSSLVWISGRNMGFTSIARVWGVGIVERLSRMKLDLEAVVEDASDEVYSFQIQKSLIYWKFVGLYIIGSHLSILAQNHIVSEILLEEGLYQ